MSVNVKKFVDIDIKSHITSNVSGTRDTVVLYTSETGTGTTATGTLISNLTDAATYYGSCVNTLAYLTIFFNNGGAKVLVIEKNLIAASDIKALDDKYIVVGVVSSSEQATQTYTSMKTLAGTLAADTTVYGVNEKILLGRHSDKTVEASSSVKNFAVKCSTVLGAEMTIAAYLSQIDVYDNDSIYDYAFTNEVISPEDISDSEYDIITGQNHDNIDIILANATRNLGGDLKDGKDLVNEYVRIILHQTLTLKLLNLLVSKIKSVDGISKIYSVMSNELNNYLVSGYLTTDKVWTDNDYIVQGGDGKSYTIITNGTPIVNGYAITILPFSALTSAEITAKSAPPIYVVIATQYGIRKITIKGEVF